MDESGIPSLSLYVLGSVEPSQLRTRSGLKMEWNVNPRARGSAAGIRAANHLHHATLTLRLGFPCTVWYTSSLLRTTRGRHPSTRALNLWLVTHSPIRKT
jgi:hypothetical protein